MDMADALLLSLESSIFLQTEKLSSSHTKHMRWTKSLLDPRTHGKPFAFHIVAYFPRQKAVCTSLHRHEITHYLFEKAEKARFKALYGSAICRGTMHWMLGQACRKAHSRGASFLNEPKQTYISGKWILVGSLYDIICIVA